MPTTLLLDVTLLLYFSSLTVCVRSYVQLKERGGKEGTMVWAAGEDGLGMEKRSNCIVRATMISAKLSRAGRD